MKYQILNLLAVIFTAAIMAFATSCKDNDPVLSDELSVSPSERDIVFETDDINAKVDGEPFTPTFTVTTNQESWDVVRGKPWIIVSKTDHTFTLSANPVTGIISPEDGWIWVSAGRADPIKIVVTQLAFPHSLVVEPEGIRNITFSSDGKVAASNDIPMDVPPAFTIDTNVETWDVQSDQPWLTCNKDGDTFTLTASVNLSLEPPEEATVTVTAGRARSVVIKVNQEGGIPILEMTGMHNEYTPPGEIIKIYGNFLIDSENTVIYFGDIQTPVIENRGTYLTARVPENVQSNVKVKAVNSTHSLEAICPGFYQDKNNVITTFDDDFPYNGTIGDNWARIVDSEEAELSGNCLAFEAIPETTPGGLGWWYLMGSHPVTFTQDMIDNPDNYILKFELKMQNAISQVEFYIYYNTANDNVMFRGEDISQMLQDWNVWQTVSIPLESIISAGAAANILNIRPQCFGLVEPINMFFDNFRIYKKGD